MGLQLQAAAARQRFRCCNPLPAVFTFTFAKLEGDQLGHRAEGKASLVLPFLLGAVRVSWMEKENPHA